MKRLLLLLSLSLTLSACEGVALRDAELADSPEAYEAYLQQYPDSVEAPRLRARTDELRFIRAKSTRTSAAMLEYLELHPSGAHVEEAKKHEDELAWYEAAGTKTAESYKGYLDSHPDGAFVEEARFGHGQIVYLPQVGVGELALERINMANDPKGPLNGWELKAEITNNGDRSLRVVEVFIDYLAADGRVVKSDKWWAVAPDLGGFPTPPEMIPTLHPKQSRTLRWTTAEQPEGAADGMFAVRIKRLEFKKD